MQVNLDQWNYLTTIEKLELSISELERENRSVNYFLASSDNSAHIIRQRLFVLTNDVVSCASNLVSRGRPISKIMCGEQKMLNKCYDANDMQTFFEWWSTKPASRGNLQFISEVKAFMYALRAVHDQAYATIICLKGSKPPAYPSMSDGLKKENGLVSQFLEPLEDYREWFYRMRDHRNCLKEGHGAGLCGPAENPGISFRHVDAENCLKPSRFPAVRISDLTYGILQTVSVFKLITQSVRS